MLVMPRVPTPSSQRRLGWPYDESKAELSAAVALVCQSVGSEAFTRLGTESLQTPRWRELDSNFPYAGAMNLVFAPFVSRPIVCSRSA
jgi:hypothetical protein